MSSEGNIEIEDDPDLRQAIIDLKNTCDNINEASAERRAKTDKIFEELRDNLYELKNYLEEQNDTNRYRDRDYRDKRN